MFKKHFHPKDLPHCRFEYTVALNVPARKHGMHESSLAWLPERIFFISKRTSKRENTHAHFHKKKYIFDTPMWLPRKVKSLIWPPPPSPIWGINPVLCPPPPVPILSTSPAGITAEPIKFSLRLSCVPWCTIRLKIVNSCHWTRSNTCTCFKPALK